VWRNGHGGLTSSRDEGIAGHLNQSKGMEMGVWVERKKSVLARRILMSWLRKMQEI
jgi:hypothetical protein